MSLRIVSLSPAATEMVVALGHADALVARAADCDFPESIQSLPIYHPDDPDEIMAHDLLITEDPSHAESTNSPQVLLLKAEDMGDVWNNVREVARVLGDEDRGHHLVFKLQQKQAHVAAGALDHPPGVVFLDGVTPLQAAGRWMPELIEMASGDNLIGLMGEASQFIEAEALIAARPEILIISPQGYTLETIREAMPTLQALTGWNDLPAVKKGQVYLADSASFFGRPGPRLVESLEMLGEMLHPATFDFGHEGTSWERFKA
jgi:iron complex transport system substrate-binding protein